MPAVLLGSFASLIVWSGLLVGPPPLPATSPAPEPDAAAEEQPEPPLESEVVPEPAETPPAETPPAETPPAVAPIGPSSPPRGPDPELAPGLEPEPDDERWVTVRAPRWRGTGMLVTGGALVGATLMFQLIDGLVFGDEASGGIERMFLAGSMAFAAGGGVMRGRADAYDDTALRRSRRETRPVLIAGAVLVGVGAVVGLVNEGLWWRCVFDDAGPYFTPSGDEWSFGPQCRHNLGRGLLDLGAVSTATGLGLLSWSLSYRRDARAYERARVIGLRPSFGRDRFGVSVGGRF